MSIRREALFVLCVISILTAAGHAAPPGNEPPGNRGEFVPHAGFTKTTKLLRARRRAGPMALAPGVPLSLSGTRQLPVILVEFNNRATPFMAADYQALLFSEAAGARSMTTYYSKVSAGKFAVKGQVLGPIKLPKDDAEYEGTNNGLGGAHFGDLLKSALTKVDVATDFGQFDNDGPDGIPNSADDDGVVDTVFFIHPEKGGECSSPPGAPANKNIWSHSWHYSEGLGHSGAFVTNDVSNRVDGDTGLPIPGAKILIDDYTIQPALACGSTPASKKIIEIGVFCHEYGHALGLPDLYDRTPGGDGIGCWCLMASGSYGGDNKHADRPTHMSAWCKYYLGWADVRPLLSVATLDFEPVDVQNRVYRFNVPGTSDLEYFLIEYRRKTDWDEFLHADGLAIWHVDETVGSASPTWPFAPQDAGQNDFPNSVQSSPSPLFNSDRSLVALIQADGDMRLENPILNATGRGDATDLFRSGDFADDPTGKRGSRAYNGNATGLAIKNIQIGSTGVKAKVEAGGTVIATAPPAAHFAQMDLTPAQAGDVQFAEGIFEIVRKDGIKGLTAQQRTRLEKLPNFLLQKASGEADPQPLVQAAAKARTKVLDMNTEIPGPLSGPLKAIVARDGDQNITVQYSPSQTAVEQISGLLIDSDGMPEVDDRGKLKGSFAGLVGEGVNLASSGTGKIGSAVDVVRFNQLAEVNGKSLPIFNKQVAFYYDKGKLIGLSSSAVQDKLTVSGDSGAMTADAAKKIAANILGIPIEKLTAVEGVSLVPGAPTQAHVAFKVSSPNAPNQQGLEMIIDATNGMIQIK